MIVIDFFAGYQQIRQRQDNANDLIETPALMQLLPDLTDANASWISAVALAIIASCSLSVEQHTC